MTFQDPAETVNNNNNTNNRDSHIENAESSVGWCMVRWTLI